MKNLRKRVLSLLLAAVMTASLLPTTAWAATPPADDSEQYAYMQEILTELNGGLPENEGYTESGPFQLGGSDVYFYELFRSVQNPSGGRVTDTRYVIVPGAGVTDAAMPDFDSVTDTPWRESNPSGVYIAKGVTHIGKNSFTERTTLNTIKLQDPNSLKSIGEHAFDGCDALEGPLDLSGVTQLGTHAFNGCEQLRKVTLGEGLTEIPNNAFNNCGLTTVNIPSTVTSIGDYAFSNNSLSEIRALALPEGLTYIGASAFALQMGEGETSSGITSLTIPASVKEIGANAFYGRRNLAEVTVTDDKVDGTKLTLGDGAFGKNEFNAYAEEGSIREELTDTVYEGLLGTKFYLPEDVADQFQSGTNCFTGDITPMEYVDTKQPTCTEEGYHRYRTTVSGAISGEGKPIEIYYYYMLAPLGHKWDEEHPVTVPATCENASYTYVVCLNEGCQARNTINANVAPALNHRYTATSVTPAAIKEENGTPTTVTYTCVNHKDGDGDLHDGDLPPTYTWTIPATTLYATTSDTLADLASQLPKPTGAHNASLQWAESDTNTELEVGEYDCQVKFVVTAGSNFETYSAEDFTIQVKVSRTKLDFSDVTFENADRWIGGNTPEFKVTGLPEGVTGITKTEYRLKSGTEEDWTEEVPEEAEITDEGQYLVRVTFTYNTEKYQLVTDEASLLPSKGYELAAGTGNTGTLTGDYTVRQMTMEDIVVETPGRTFNGTSDDPDGSKQSTVRLSGVPDGSKVTMTWMENGVPQEEVVDETTSPVVNGAYITDAGTYTVSIKVENGQYKPFERTVQVTIVPQTVTAPEPNPAQQYTGKPQTGVNDSGDGRYTLTGNTETNAGSYTAKATLVSDNYVWNKYDEDGNGIAEIPWQILYRLLQKPTIQEALKSTEYDGTEKKPLSILSGDITPSYGDAGTLSAKFNGEVAYTATNAKGTDAQEYPVTVHLANKNYKWTDQTTDDVKLTWKITPKQIGAPTVQVSSAVYDGSAYNLENTEITLTDHSEDSEGVLTLGEHTYYQGQTKLPGAPTDAGNYNVNIGFAYAEGEKAENYQIIGNIPYTFRIDQAQLTLTAPTEESELKVDYTGSDYTVPAPEVKGWQNGETAETAKGFALSYSYVFTPADRDPEEEKTATGELTVRKAGSYAISVTVDDGCQNYTEAEAAEYTFNIGAAEQTVELSSTDDAWTGTSITKTLGEAGFTVTGTGSLDKNSVMAYVYDSETEGMLTVNETTGAVTMRKAGTATVTVSTEGTANAGAAKASYTVTVEKATPTVTVNLPEGGQEGVYGFTGQPLTFTATVTGVGNGAEAPTGTDEITYTFYENNDDGEPGQSLGTTQPTAVGTYWVTAAYGGDANYTSQTSAAQSFTISPAQLTVKVLNPYDGEDYDGSAHAAAAGFTVTGNGQDLTDAATITYAESADGDYTDSTMPQVKDAGEYTVYYKVSVPNYDDSTGKFTVKVNPYNVTLKGDVTKTKPYDGKQDAQVKTVNGASYSDGGVTIAGAGTEKFTVQADALYNDADAGKGTVITITYTLSGADLSNYTYNGEPITGNTVTQEVTGASITPREITVVGVDAQDRAYDGTKDVTLTETDSFGFAADAIVSEDKGKVTLTFVGGTGTVSDEKASNDAKTVTVTPGSVVTLGGDEAGNYTVAKVVTDADSDEIDVEISRREVTLSVKDVDSENKIEKGYTGSAITLTAEITDEVFVEYVKAGLNQEDVDFTFKQGETEKEPVTQGTYGVTVSLKEEAENKYLNFAIQSGGCTLEITNATLEVTSAPYTGTYNGDSHDVLEDWSFRSSTGSAVDKEQVTVTFQLVGADNADEPNTDGVWIASNSFVDASQSGRYWYRVEYGSHNTVYGEQPVTITIDPAPLTLDSSLSVTGKTYDGTTDIHEDNGTLTSKVTGIVEKDKAGVSIKVEAAYVSPNAGTQDIEVKYTFAFTGGVLPGNYQYGDAPLAEGAVLIQTVKGAIEEAPLTIELKPQHSVYNGSVPSASSDEGTWKVTSGEIYSQNGEKDDLGITLTITGAGADADTYTLTATATGTDSGNYDVRVTNSTYTVTARPVTIQIGDASGVYGEAHSLTAGTGDGQVTLEDITADKTSGGIVSREDIYAVLPGLTLTTDAGEKSPVGDKYKVTAENEQYGNYQVTFTPGKYTVTPRPVTVTIADKDGLYGQDMVKLTWKVTSGTMAEGEDLDIQLDTDAAKGSDVGTYAIYETARDEDIAANYTVTVVGESAFGEHTDQATYTIDRAVLKAEPKADTLYAQYGQSIANPLTFTNESADSTIAGGSQDYRDLTKAVRYAYAPAEGLKLTSEDDPAAGAFTVNVSGQTVTVTVTVAETKNFQGAETQFQVLASTSGSLQVTLPFAELTYNGGDQMLLEKAPALPDGVAIRYKVGETGTWTDYSDTDPANWKSVTGQNAGSYAVYWETTAGGDYNASSGHESVEIQKAELQGTFADGKDSVTYLLAEVPESHTIELDLSGNRNYAPSMARTYTSDNDTVAYPINNNNTITLTGQVGTAEISIWCPGDANYKDRVFTFTITVSETELEMTVVKADKAVEYDGQAHTLTVEVTDPVSAQVLYADETGAYTLTAPPAYTDVKRAGNDPKGAVEGYEIKFQITAPGYKTVEDSATLTIQSKPITADMFKDSIGSYTYTGKRIVPDPVVKDGTLLLVKGKDYTVTWGTPNQNVGPYDAEKGTGGTVTVTGMGNYGGEDFDTFEITAVGQNSLTAAMTRSWGVYGDVDTNNTIVTVSHGDLNNGGHPVDGSEITITVTDVDENEVGSDKATVDKATQTVTFHEVGQYTLTVTVSGNHSGSFTLHYTLLPAGGDEGLTLTVDGKPTPAVYTYGDKVDGDIAVKANDKALTEGQDYTLTYSYQPFAAGGNIQPVEAGTDYDPAQVFGEKIPAAGLYVVTAQAVPDGSYTGSGTFVFLVQQKNLEDGMIGAIGGQTYTGEKIEPGVTVSFIGDGADNLIAAEDYAVAYQDNINAGTAKIIVTAKAESNNFTGAASATFEIGQKDLSSFDVALIDEQRHTGAAITPALTVTDPDRKEPLIQGLDFTADYKNNINVGEAQVTITGMGNYMGTITGTTFRIVATASSFDLALDKTDWTWGESGPADAKVSYTSGGAEAPLAIGTDYVLTVGGTEYTDRDAALAALGTLEPGTHTVTARGKTGTGYADLSDTVTVTVAKIQPVLEITASPHTLSSAGEVTLTLKGEDLPADVDNLPELLTVAATGGTAPDLEKLTWTEDPAGTWTAKVSLPNASSTYTFTLAFTPDGANAKYYESARASDTVVTAQHTSSGGGGGGGGGQATAFTITASAGTGGDITPAGAVAVVRGGSQSFAIAPAAGYEIADVLVDGDSVGAVSSYTFSNVTKNHTITVSFNRTEEIADPDETGVSGWLNTTDHMAYMQGYPGNLFGPDDNMTRAEAAQMFYNLLLDKDVAITVSFTDVEESAWYSRAVHVLASLGVLEGVGGGLFAPERSITRAEFTAIAMRFADLKTDGDNPFSDVYEHEWFYDVVVGSVRYGWINGYPDGTFRPYDTIARAEAAAATNRMLGRSADRDYVDAHPGALTRFDDVGTGYWAYYEIMEAANGHTYRRDDAFEDWTGLT